LPSVASAKEGVTEASNLLQLLYSEGSNCELKIRELVSAAFPGIEIALDFTVPQAIEFRIGTNFDKLPKDPRDSIKILSNCQKLDEQGDGLRSYVGVVTALTVLKRPLFLIDEPEAFLHPPQAARIGRFIASQASDERQIIVATHSSDVLRGIIFASREAQIVRLQKQGEKYTVCVLNKTDLQEIANDPLLSAAGVMDGLFYSGVVVTEAEADSRFYMSASNKMNESLDFHFINADNKQTVPKVVATYKKLNVRSAGIVDIDVINDAKEFKKQVDALGLSGDELRDVIEAQRQINIFVVKNNLSENLGLVINELKVLGNLPNATNPVLPPFLRFLL